MTTIGTSTSHTYLPTTPAPNVTPATAPPADTSGGGLGDMVLSGIGKLVSFASKGMQSIQDALNGEMSASGGGAVNAAKVQGYVMQMSNYDNIMKMAAKLQEKEDEAVKVWLR